MRKSLLAACLLFFIPAWAAPLPEGGKDIAMPGFSVHTPGAPWLVREPVEATNKDGSLFEDRRPGFNIYFRAFPNAGDLRSVFVNVSGTTIQVAARDLKGVIAEIKTQQDAAIKAPSTRNRLLSSSVSEAVVNGNLCVRTEATSEDRGVPGHEGEPFILAIHDLMCPHPDFPAFVVSIEYSTRLPPGGALFVPEGDGYGVQNSLRFAPLGYRVTQIPLGPMAQMLTEADSAIWVASGGTNGKVVRIDPKTNAVAAEIAVGKLPIGIAGDESGVWVANRDDNTVMQIDPKTNTVTKTVKVSGGPQLMAAGAGAIWVASLNGPVWRIDPGTGAALKISGVGDQLAGIAVVDNQVYVADYQSDRIARIDPATNKVVARIKAARFAAFLLADGTQLWASIQEARPAGPCVFCTAEEASPVHRFKSTAILHLDTAAPDAPPAVFATNIGNMPRGSALWQGKLWVANWTGASLSVLDPKAPQNASYFPVGVEPVSVLSAQGALWVTLSGPTPALLRLDPQ